ncbi:Uncharacterised protein [Mycobacteroides abscessus subsp. abscessus]|nr:Uncharacterised protein [Mycobacteroides abscessus subsp. abscessus]
MSVGMYTAVQSVELTLAFRAISRATVYTEYEEAADVAAELTRELYGFIDSIGYWRVSGLDSDTREEKAECARMKDDPEYLEQKFAEAIAHYESIKHLI